MKVYGYSFDGDYYADTEAGKQALLEEISNALDTEVWSDPDMKDATDGERQEAVSMAFDGTHYAADFWANCISIRQMSPYTLDIARITEDSEPALISECCECLGSPNPVDVAYIASHGLTEVEDGIHPYVLADGNGMEYYGGSLHDAVQEHREAAAALAALQSVDARKTLEENK